MPRRRRAQLGLALRAALGGLWAASAAKREPPRTPEENGGLPVPYQNKPEGVVEAPEQLLSRIGAELSCDACMGAMKRFKFDVSRHIKGKGTREEKERQMDTRFNKSHPCDEKYFHKDLVVSARSLGAYTAAGEVRKRFQPRQEVWMKTGTAMIKTGKEVREDAIEACHHWTDGHRDVLLDAMDAKKKGRMNDINFFKLVCFKPGVACVDALDGEERIVEEIEEEDDSDMVSSGKAGRTDDL